MKGKVILNILCCYLFIFSFCSVLATAQTSEHTNNIVVRSDRVLLLNGKPFFPIVLSDELGQDNYQCQLRKPDGSSWGFNVINLQTEVTWHFKKFGGYCPDEPDLDYCGSGYRIRNIISGDVTTSPQYQELLGPMGWDISWQNNANRIFDYLDKDMFILADDYAFYPSTVDWFEQNGGCRYPNCVADCDSIYPRFDQATRNASIDRIDSLAKQTNSRLIGFYGLDDPAMMHTKYNHQNEEYFFANIDQQLLDFQNTYNYSKTKYPNSIVVFSTDVLYYPKALSPEDPRWQDWNLVMNNWVNDIKKVVAASDVIATGFYDASKWDPNWCLYPDQTKAMWYANHLEQTVFPRLINPAGRPVAVMGGFVFDEINFAPVPPFLDAKTKWISYIGIEKGVTGLGFFGWHKGHESDTLNLIWNSVRNLVDTLVNVKHLTDSVFTKSNIGPVGHNVSGSTNPNVSYAVFQANGWNDYYMLVTNNPNGVINQAPEPDNMVTLSSSVADWKSSRITEIFSGNRISASSSGLFQYEFPCWGVAVFHVQSNNYINNVPDKFYLSQNYPNPFNPSTQIDYGIHDNSFVSIKVYNSLGQQVASLVNSYMPAGKYSVQFFASSFPSGIYYYKMKAGNFEQSKKLVLIK